MSTNKELERELVKSLYGGTLDPRGRGFYVTLEFLSIFWGAENKLEPDGPIVFKRRSLDFARRLLYYETEAFKGGVIDPLELSKLSDDTVTISLLKTLLRSLKVQVPFARAEQKWFNSHLYPYVGELIHYDAVNRGDALNMERYLYRGGGTIIYDVLRRDGDDARRKQIRDRLTQIVREPSDTTLGRIAKTLESLDQLEDDEQFQDETLFSSDGTTESHWCELARSGTLNILKSIDSAKAVEHLMYWLPYCLARHALSLSFKSLERNEPGCLVDMTGREPTLRRESQRLFQTHRRVFVEAVEHLAGAKERQSIGAEKSFLQEISRASENARISNTVGAPEAFYSTTMAALGVLNHNSGVRHYTLKLPMIETIVHACVDSLEGVSFESFCTDILWKQLGLVVDASSGHLSEVTQRVDSGVLGRNEAALADRLRALGLMTTYSDATRMVGVSR